MFNLCILQAGPINKDLIQNYPSYDKMFLSLFNENDGEYNCQIVKITKDNIEVKILDKTKNITNNYKLSLAFCPPKKIKLEVLMQKATELGIKSFHPLI